MRTQSDDAPLPQRNSYLDAYRGIACLMVCFYHSATNLRLGQVTLWGFTGVHLFFIISGYLIFQPFLRSLLTARPLPSTSEFYRKRFVRIVPPYLVALVLYIALRVATHTNIPSLPNIVRHIFLVFNYSSEKDFFSINPVLWSLAIESQFYLLLPLCVYLARRIWKPSQYSPHKSVVVLLCLFFITGIVSRGLEFHHFYALQPRSISVLKFRSIFSFLDMFSIGMAIAALEKSGAMRRCVQRIPALWPLLIGGVLVVTANLWCTLVSPGEWMNSNDFLYTLFFSPLVCIGFGFFLLTNVCYPTTQRSIVNTFPLVSLGLISYSVYLYHVGVQFAVFGRLHLDKYISSWSPAGLPQWPDRPSVRAAGIMRDVPSGGKTFSPMAKAPEEGADRMKLHIIAPVLPPRLDGIGDYTAALAAQLAAQGACDVTILTGVEAASAPIAGVRIAPTFCFDTPSSVACLRDAVLAECPDWLLLQYNPFAYGKWGRNLYLPHVLHGLKRDAPRTRLAVMVHETFVPVSNWKFAIMTTWQRAQLWQLGQAADTLFFSIQPWARQFQRWFPGKTVAHLPVSSNIPRVAISRGAARQRLNFANEDLVVGLFGTAHMSRMLPLIGDTLYALEQAGHKVTLLYIGPDTEAIRARIGKTRLRADGALPGNEVSCRFAAQDMYLAAFLDGISTRRTSLMTALQHGIAIVGNRAAHTDGVLLAEAGSAFLVADTQQTGDFQAQALQMAGDAALRARLGAKAAELFEREFTWERIAARLLHALQP